MRLKVASLELCKELYGVSRWDETHFIYYDTSATLNGKDPVIRERPSRLKTHVVCSAYDLGYLLQKLPRNVPNGHNSGSYWLDNSVGDSHTWTVCYENAYGDYTLDTHADTPEDAAAKLATDGAVLVCLAKGGLYSGYSGTCTYVRFS